MQALIIGGTRFIGRHTVLDLLEAGYDVTTLTRGRRAHPFADHPAVEHVRGTRNERSTLVRARDACEPDIVIDCIARVPQQVRAALDVFADVDAYVFVSSIAAYAGNDLPRREETTPLEAFLDEHAVEDPAAIDPMDEWAAYGPRKAECDRECFRAAAEGTNALVARPTYVFGPHDYTERFDYWIDRVRQADRILVPGDGDNIVHQVYVEDVASALRVIAEAGTPGEAYNVTARQFLTLDGRLEQIAAALDADVEFVHASARELARYDLEPTDYPLVRPEPVVIDSTKLARLGWTSTAPTDAIRSTVESHLERARPGREHGPDPERERTAIEAITESS